MRSPISNPPRDSFDTVTVETEISSNIPTTSSSNYSADLEELRLKELNMGLTTLICILYTDFSSLWQKLSNLNIAFVRHRTFACLAMQ